MNGLFADDSFKPNRRFTLALFYAVVVTFILLVGLEQAFSNDLWKALYTGRYIALEGGFPAHHNFTFMPVKTNLSRHGWTWLGNLCFYGTYKIGELPALQFFRLFLMLFPVLLFHSLVDYRPGAGLLALFSLFLLGIKQKLMLRNALFLIPFLALLIWSWARFSGTRSRKIYLFIPPTIWLWSNLHGSYLVGLGFLGLFVLGKQLDSWLADRSGKLLFKYWLVLGLSLAGTILLHPRGPDLHPVNRIQRLVPGNHSSTVSTGGRNDLSKRSSPAWSSWLKQNWRYSLFKKELYSTEFDFPLDNLHKIYVAASLLVLLLGTTAFVVAWPVFRWELFLPFLGSVYLGLAVLRAVAVIPLVCVGIMLTKASRGDFDDFSGNRWYFIGALSLTVFLLCYLTLGPLFEKPSKHFSYNDYRPRGFGRHPRFSRAVPAYLRREYPNVKVLNAYDLGSWLIWNWWPQRRVFIDSKNSAYAEEFRKHIFNKNYVQLAREYKLSVVVLPLDSELLYAYFIPAPKWRLLAFDRGMVALARKNFLDNRGQTEPRPVGQLRLEPVADQSRSSPELKRLMSRVEQFISSRRNSPAEIGRFQSP